MAGKRAGRRVLSRLLRPHSPEVMLISDFATLKVSARKAIKCRLALPYTGGGSDAQLDLVARHFG